MKVIDLLNKIAKGKAPKKFKYKNKVFYSVDNDYWCAEISGWFSLEVLKIPILNDEVEIIEEDKKIELLHYHSADNELEYNGRMYKMRVIDRAFVEKIDELIEEIEKLKGKSE